MTTDSATNPAANQVAAPKPTNESYAYDMENREKSAGLKPRLNAIHGAALIVGATIGSGIFLTPGGIYQKLGGGASGLLIWVVGAFVAYMGAMVYGEWACRIPESGGDAPFLDRAYKRPYRFVAFVYSFTRVMFINPGYIAAQAISCAGQVIQLVDRDPKEESLLIFAISALLTASLSMFCCLSNNVGSRLFLILTIMAIVMTAFIGIWAPFLLFNIIKVKSNENFKSNLWRVSGVENSNPGIMEILGNISNAFILTMWAFDGWANLSSSVGEIKNPRKNVRLANIIGLGTITTLYLLCNVSYILAIPIDANMPPDLAPQLLENLKIFSTYGSKIINCIIIITTTSCAFTMTYSSCRIAQATGESRLLAFPNFFAKLDSKFGTPIKAVAVTTVMTLLICSTSLITPKAFNAIVSAVSFAFWFFCGLTVFGLILVRHREGTLWKFRSPNPEMGVFVNPIFPILLVISIIVFLGFSFNDEPTEDSIATWKANVASLVAPAIAVPLYFWQRRNGQLSKND